MLCPRDGHLQHHRPPSRRPTHEPELLPRGCSTCLTILDVGDGAQERHHVWARDATTGAVVPGWDPNPDGVIWALAMGPETVYAAGGYERMNGVPVGSIAALNAVPTSSAAPPARSLTVVPNPVYSSATLRFALAASAPVTLAVFDVQGRRIATLLNDTPLAPGEHTVPVGTRAWPAGCYLARLEAGGVTTTRKMVVLSQGR